MPYNKNNTPTISNVKNTGGATGKVKTNTSWKGDYLTVDFDKDYGTLMQDAHDRGDYSQAANFEALRNAKINYLNQTNGTNYETTNNYIKDYNYANNQGGKSYVSGTTMNNMINGSAGTYNIGGSIYKKNTDGTYSQKSGATTSGAVFNKVGDKVNETTGEFQLTNPVEARRKYLVEMGHGVYNGTDANGKEIITGAGHLTDDEVNRAYDYLASIGRVDQGYLDAIVSGTTGEYTKNVIANAKVIVEDVKRKQEAGAALTKSEQDIYEQAKALADPEAVIEEMNKNGTLDKTYEDLLRYQYAVGQYRIQ